MSKKHPDKQASQYEKKKAAERARQARISASGRELGDLPPVATPERRGACRRDFEKFCLEYFPETFALPFSQDHKKIIQKTEGAVLHGDLFAMAMPRGSGKTTICEMAALWALLYGHRRCVVLVGADLEAATDMLDDIKNELESNDRLGGDFPEVCVPVRALDGITQRAKGQLYRGKRTHIEWTAKKIVLPTIDGSPSSGGVIVARGITGRIRGFKASLPTGGSIRPDLVVIDDPQTDESAQSASQSANREKILSGAILGMAGPGKKIAGLMPCTVIAKGDMADRILDRDIHPRWQGERTKMVYSFPENMKLWEQYKEVLDQGYRDGKRSGPANEFYLAHREEMDKGAVVAWPERYNSDEYSAIQHAMNLLYRDEEQFWAEYQNEPVDSTESDGNIVAEHILRKLNRRKRNVVPDECTRVTAFVDVMKRALYYAVIAWTERFDGFVIDYGTFPKQNVKYFSLQNLRNSLEAKFPKKGLEARWYAGFEAVADLVLGREYLTENGKTIRCTRLLIDANDGAAAGVVDLFCQQTKYQGLVMPSRARAVTASRRPFSDYRPQKGDRVGHNWRVPAPTRRAVRYLLHDSNYWKSFVRARWLVDIGDPGALSVWGDEPEDHRLFADHCTAEYSIRVSASGRTVDEWRPFPGRENHYLDCVVGCAVAASEQGISLQGVKRQIRRKKIKKISLGELQRRKRAERNRRMRK